MLPTVSIVGRPNVGKSTFFNRLIGQRKAIVHNSSGVTRDRHYGECFWNGKDFSVIDTGGYVTNDTDVIISSIRDQVHLAMDESNVIIFLVDAQSGISDLDRAVANMLREQNKPVIIAANKADNEKIALDSVEFYEFGFEYLFPISSVNGTGTGELLDKIAEFLPDHSEHEASEHPKLAIIGRPNVGKSSLLNTLVNDQRSIVSDVAGTTRDTINTDFIYNDKTYTLLDTAGLRRRTKVKESIEFYSTIRTDRAIKQCDIALLLIDAEQGLEAQDVRVLNEAEKYNKGIILVINKWDLIEKETNTLRDYIESIYQKIPMMRYIPIISISALTGQRVIKIMEIVEQVLEEREKVISTGKFNKFLEKILKEKSLPFKQSKQLSIKYGIQAKSKPPVFLFFMNNPWELPANYRRYIESKLRDKFSFMGVPITLVFKEK